MNNTEHEFILPYQNEGSVDLPAYYAYITLNFMNISSGCGSARLERLPWADLTSFLFSSKPVKNILAVYELYVRFLPFYNQIQLIFILSQYLLFTEFLRE
jgi:hypothetical protein